MTQENGSIDVVLWGASQVGKTTALAAYLCHQPQSTENANDQHNEWLDRQADETVATLKWLNRFCWNYLRKNLRPPSTIVPQFFKVKHADGRLIRFRDMKGGHAVDPTHAESDLDYEAVRNASALIYFVEWPGQRIVNDLIAVEQGKLYAPDCPSVLAVTKVECFLSPAQFGRFFHDPIRVAVEMKSPAGFIQILNGIPPDNIFPISVYGYSEEGFPAQYYDEFGRLVPQNIKPVGVDSLFERVLKGLV